MWRAGLASSGREPLLKEEANFKLTKTGVHGILPHLSYVGEGEVDKPVQYITLGKNYIKATKPSYFEEGVEGSNNYTDRYGSTYTFQLSFCN